MLLSNHYPPCEGRGGLRLLFGSRVAVSLDSEIGTTEYSEHTENKRVGREMINTRKMSALESRTHSISVHSVCSVVPHLPFQDDRLMSFPRSAQTSHLH